MRMVHEQSTTPAPAQPVISGFEQLIDDTALANRYRPRRLSEVVGQEHVTRILMAQNRSGNFQHPVKIFSGDSGCGKTTIARALAAFELCENPDTELGDACGQCASCLAVVNGKEVHPDVHELDASSNTSRKEDVERLVRRFTISPMQGSVQVFILDEAQGLSRAAEDALLKPIENLPPHNRVYLLTTEPDAIPATIKGRAQHFQLTRPSPSKIAEHLTRIASNEGWPLTREMADVIVALTPESEGVRAAVTNLSKVAVLFEEGGEVSVDEIKSVLGGVDQRLLDAVVDAVEASQPTRALELISELRANVASRDLYRGLTRTLQERWRAAVLAGRPSMQLLDLSDELLAAVRSDDYTDFLVELAVVKAATPAGGVAFTAPPPVQPAPDPDPADVVEVSEAPPQDADAVAPRPEGSEELASRLQAALEAVQPRPHVVLALVAQHGAVRSDGSTLEVVLPSPALAQRLTDPRQMSVLESAAKTLGFTEVNVSS